MRLSVNAKVAGYSKIAEKKAFCNHGCHKNSFIQKHFSQIPAWDNAVAEMLCAISENADKRLKAVVEANGGCIEQK